MEALGLQLTQGAVALRHDRPHALALLPRHRDAAALGDEGGAQLREQLLSCGAPLALPHQLARPVGLARGRSMVSGVAW